MEVDHGFEGALDVGGGFPGGEGLLFVEVVEEGAALDVLEDEVDGVVMLKEAIELDDVGVIERIVEFDFLLELVDHFILFNFLLLHFFQGHQIPRFYVLGQVNLPEFTHP